MKRYIDSKIKMETIVIGMILLLAQMRKIEILFLPKVRAFVIFRTNIIFIYILTRSFIKCVNELKNGFIS